VHGQQQRAAADPGVRSVVVHYGDLNLSTAAGARTLHARIRGAARFVCGEEGRSLHEQGMWRSCYRDAMANAIATVNSPLLSHAQSGTLNVTAMLNR
jgi:UrcA family protein